MTPEIVQRLVGVGLPLRLRVVRVDGSGAGLLVHQVAFQLHSKALVLRFGGFQLKLRVNCRLLRLRIAHLQQDRVGLHL